MSVKSDLGDGWNDPSLFFQALTHRSYPSENRDWQHGHNERLEFLGDAVLEILVTEYLYKTFHKATEGELTAMRSSLVSTETLSKLAETLGMWDHLRMSRGERKSSTPKGRQRLCANVYEAVVGALYLDQGLVAANIFVSQTLFKQALQVINLNQDVKGELQEKAQAHLKITPTYRLLRAHGPDHAKQFEVGVFFGSRLVAKSNGGSKKDAERGAALKALLEKDW